MPMKIIILTLLLLGAIFLGLGTFQISKTEILQNKSLTEAKEKIKHPNNPALSSDNNNEALIGEVVGILKIPAIKGELPIIEGTDEDDLEKGVGHFKGSAFPNEKGQIVLSGHRDTVFRRVGELKIGDLLSISLASGSYWYQIESTKIVDANDRSIITLQKKKEVLTLTTCYPFTFIGNAPDRYIITAKPIKEEK